MNNIKTTFTINDLENLSGIKAHTIRIWEKRYSLLHPARTDSNIRFYDIKSLQKLLNITLLYNNGYKISKIAQYSENQLPVMVREFITKSGVENHALNSFKLSMLNFDQSLFEYTYNQLLAQKSFRDVFTDVFVPLLEDIGILWQTETITPAHEHFISNLIKQKIHLNTERLQLRPPEQKGKVFVLFLPLNEIHELGLLYLHYELILHGYHSVYLGQSVPIESLKDVQDVYDNITFVSYFTVQPTSDMLKEYISEFQNTILNKSDDEFWIFGRKTSELKGQSIPKKMSVFEGLRQVYEKI